jgi:hypothetical protein
MMVWRNSQAQKIGRPQWLPYHECLDRPAEFNGRASTASPESYSGHAALDKQRGIWWIGISGQC